ncbi:hypothetical protein D3C85_1424960 [compost metagenome]
MLSAANSGPLSCPRAKQAVSRPALRWAACGANSRERCITNCMHARNGVPHNTTPRANPTALGSRQANTPAACSHKATASQRGVVRGSGVRRLASTTPTAAISPKQGQNRSACQCPAKRALAICDMKVAGMM